MTERMAYSDERCPDCGALLVLVGRRHLCRSATRDDSMPVYQKPPRGRIKQPGLLKRRQDQKASMLGRLARRRGPPKGDGPVDPRGASS